MHTAPKSGREIEDHHVRKASPFLTRLLSLVGPGLSEGGATEVTVSR